MPYFIEVRGQAIRFPPVCSCCWSSAPLHAYDDDHSQATAVEPITGHIFTRTARLQFPMCKACLRRGARLTRISFGLMFLPWLVVCLSAKFTDDPEARAMVALTTVTLAMASAIAGVCLLLYVHRGRRGLKIVYAGADALVFSSKSGPYAELFAALNDSTAVEKPFYVRLR